MCRLCTGGSSEIGPNGRVSDDRELYSTIRGRQVVHEGSWLHNCGYSLGLTVVFKCSRETGNAWGIVAACFWGLLRDNGCIQRFGGVGTGLLLCVFPLFTYHN
jgi:hypothetical protein